MVPLEGLLGMEGVDTGMGIRLGCLASLLLVGQTDVVVLQRTSEVVGVAEEEVLRHVHELEQSHVSALSYLCARLAELLVQLVPQLAEGLSLIHI